MNDLKELLGRGIGAFEPSRDGLDRTQERVRRRRRTQRLSAAAVAVVLSVAGVAFLASAFRARPNPSPLGSPAAPASNGDIWVRVGGGDGPSFVYKVDPVTGGSTPLFNDGQGPSDLPGRPSKTAVGQQYDWAPDGSRLAFSDYGGYANEGTEIYLLSPDGSSRSQVTHDRGLDSFPSWSPSGTTIAYASDTGPPPSGSALDYTPGCEYSMAMCPSNIWAIEADGSGEHQLTHDPAGATMPDWSPDGSKIAFVSGAHNGDIYVMNSDGSGITQLTSGSGFDALPQWSPDGTQVGFSRGADGPYELWIVNADGSDARQITTIGSTTVGSFAWAPDGTQIAYDTGGDEHAGVLFFVSPQGPMLREIQVAKGYGLGDIAWQPITA